MNIELDQRDIELIAQRVLELIKPLLINNHRQDDTVFDVDGLSQYLHVDPSWIYKQVSYKTIPYFKCGKYIRFKKSQIDKWVATKSCNIKP